MRILHVITLCELGGAQSVVVNLSNYLSKDHEVIVAAGEGDGKMFHSLNPSIKIERIPSLIRSLSPLKEIKAIREMRKLYKKYNPDIIHLHSSKAGILGRLAFPKSKIVYTVHGFDSIRLAFRKFLPFEKALQYECSHMVSVSKYDESNLLSEGIKHNLSTIYNGTYTPAALQGDPFAKFRNYKKIVLSIARLAPPKNHKLFIEVAKKMPDVAFLWIGNQTEPDFQYPSNVHFLGSIASAGSYIRYADLFMLLSNYEGLPIVVIEALASGVPVVASSVGGITELLDGKNGIAVDNDVDKIASRSIEILTADIDNIQSMSKHAIKTYTDNFTIDKMAKGYLEVYNNIYQSNSK